MADTIEIIQGTATTIEIAGLQGPQGPAGATGGTGAAGQGVPVGGTTGQVLRKVSGTNYDTEWAAAAAGSGSVTSVALAGTGLSISGSPVTTSGTITANVSYGTTAGTATQGNDGRIATIGSGAINTATGVIQTEPETLEVYSINRSGLADIKAYSVQFVDDQITGYMGSLNLGNLTANRGYYMPNATGTVALTQQATDYEVTDSTAGIILKSPNNTRWRLTINNDGTLSRAALALMTLLAFATSGFAQVRDMVTDASGNIVTGRTNVLTFTNRVSLPISSGAATTNSLLTADGAGGSAFVASRTQTVAMTNSAFRTNTTDTSTANAQTNMVLNLDASSTYHFAFAFIVTSATTGGFNARLLHSNTTNGLRNTYVGRMGRPINIAASDITASSAGTISLQAVNFAGTNIVVTGTGILSTGTSSGTLTFIWYQNTATNVATELVSGSMITVTKINP
jgi:hypothetical protein